MRLDASLRARFFARKAEMALVIYVRDVVIFSESISEIQVSETY